jgi:hypothetical protein
MRYNLESTLPIHAFQPLGGRHNPFKQRMTLEGGNPVSAITNPISKALGTSGGGGGVLGALASVDKAVGNTIPGGWATVAAVAVPYAAPYLTGAALTAGQAAALAAGTSAATSAIQGRNLEDTLKAAALAGATSYGLNSLSSANELDSLALPSDTPYVDLPDGAVLLSGGAPAPDLSGIALPSETPYVDLADEGTLLSSGPSSAIQSNELPSDVIDLPDTGTSYSNLPAELNLDALYQDMPDGINQLSPVSQETIAASISQPALTPEEKIELLIKKAQDTGAQPTISYSDSGIKMTDYSAPATEETQKMIDMGILERASDMPGYIYEAIKNNPTTAAAIGLGALTLSGDRAPQQEEQSAPTKRTYSYGTSREVADPYLIKNRSNARSVYEPRYAEGGEVKRFGVGGLSNALTRVFQPIERAVIQPIGQAAPFLKDIAPYAGILAAPFIANPFAAAGVGALSSGFGRPGTGFNMKRALMGGIAAYGASTAGGGLEAAGTEPATTAATTTSNLVSAPPGTVGESLVNQTSSLVKEPSTGFFRDPAAMQRGVTSLLGPDSKAAAARFGTQAGTFKSGVPIVMGISGMSAIDEGQKMQEEADIASAPARQANVDMLARIAASKNRAKKAVLENPYQFAEGGSVDDERGGDYSSIDQGNLGKGLFGLGYAAGGLAKYASGGIVGYAEGGIAKYDTGGNVSYNSQLAANVQAAYNQGYSGSQIGAALIASGVDQATAAAATGLSASTIAQAYAGGAALTAGGGGIGNAAGNPGNPNPTPAPYTPGVVTPTTKYAPNTSGGVYADKPFSDAAVASFMIGNNVKTPAEINYVRNMFGVSADQIVEAQKLIARNDPSIAEAGRQYAEAIAARPSAVSENLNAIVTQLYSQQLGRAPGAEDLKYWTGQLATGANPQFVAQSLNRSLEGQVHETQAIESAFRQNLQRSADQEGFQFWQSAAQAQGLTAQQLIDQIAKNASVEQMSRNIKPGTKFTEMELASLVSDPFGGRRPTTSIYDLPTDVKDRANISYIDGTPVQFVTPLTERPYTSVFKDGTYSGTAGDFVMNVPLINEYLTRQMDSGALNLDQYRTISRVLSDPTKTAEDRIAALSAPKSNVIIDPKYGLQTGEDVDLAKARAEAEQRQAVLNVNDPGYFQSGDLLAQAYKAAGLDYPFMPETYKASTMMTKADLLTPENIAEKSRQFAETNPYLISNVVNAENVYTFDQPQAQQALGLAQLTPQAAQVTAQGDANSANIYPEAATPTGMAGGGIARFLSGGGDGMSDSIKANIEGTQEARLADGEFVIPADVVSHLGNGSSKAGAKQLYSMMDRVRKARTGNQKQGRQIKPMKMMPA